MLHANMFQRRSCSRFSSPSSATIGAVVILAALCLNCSMVSTTWAFSGPLRFATGRSSKSTTTHPSQRAVVSSPWSSSSPTAAENPWNIAFSTAGPAPNKKSINNNINDILPATTTTTTTISNKSTTTVLRRMKTLFIATLAYAAFRIGQTIATGGLWRYYLAGGVCASVSHALAVPIDVVKTRQQLELGGASSTATQIATTTTTTATATTETPKATKLRTSGTVWSGLAPTALGYFFEGALKFGIYEGLKCRNLGMGTSAAIAGTVASVGLCPMEALRIRMVLRPDQSTLATAHAMIKELGVRRAFTKGLGPMLCKQVPYTMTKNVSFDVLCRYGYATAAVNPAFVPLTAAAITSVLACLASQPGDLVLSLAHAKKNDEPAAAATVTNWRGVKALFVGLQARLWHVGMIVTVQLLIYDFVKRLCGIVATGMA